MSNTKRSSTVLPTHAMPSIMRKHLLIIFSVRNQICNTTFLLVINLESASSKDLMIYGTKGFLKGEMMNYSSVAENQIRVLNSIYFSAI